MIGSPEIFQVDPDALESMQWFIDEIYADTANDFFDKQSVAYSKDTQEFSAESIFKEWKPL